MESEFDSNSTANILKSSRDGKKGQSKSRAKVVLGTILGLILGLVVGCAITYVVIDNIDEEKEPGKLIFSTVLNTPTGVWNYFNF